MKKKRIITLALAAALLIALGVTAYAGGWFDRKQVIIVEPRSTKNPEAEKIEIVDGETETIEITGEEMGGAGCGARGRGQCQRGGAGAAEAEEEGAGSLGGPAPPWNWARSPRTAAACSSPAAPRPHRSPS